MDWKIFFATFGLVFLAELADKTQLVSIGMSARSGKPFSVWFGSVAAYMAITAVSVLIGAVAGKYLKAEMLRFGSAAIFIIVGILIILKKI